jgi:hypothetical protein
MVFEEMDPVDDSFFRASIRKKTDSFGTGLSRRSEGKRQKNGTVGSDTKFGLGTHRGVGWFVAAGPGGEHVWTAGHQD